MQDQSFEPTGRHHHHRSDAAPWVFGGVLIVAGVFMLLRNMLGLDFGNWWSLFILIPAIGSLAGPGRCTRFPARSTKRCAVRWWPG